MSNNFTKKYYIFKSESKILNKINQHQLIIILNLQKCRQARNPIN